MRFLLLLSAVLSAGEVSFNRDIRPIMADTCFRCHGHDKSSRMANLRLDEREEAIKPTRRGDVPIVPGDPDKSLIIKRIFADKPGALMPPASSHKTLTAEQKDKIRQWVKEGAVYEGHWAYQPIRRPDVPTGFANAIDAFVQSKLAANGLTASPEADKRTLLRRVSLDLTGLPPTPEELAAFAKDTSPGAYERVVDRLLASDAYAEKQAMYWLDAVRYADTAGFHGDNAFPAWPYRDYVLKSIRDNKPFDQFTREQLAGDLLPNPTVDSRVASAFNRLARMSAEGGIQPKEYLAKYGADRVRTVAGIWLGATLGCAECHDHKFDPIASRDFYAMKAFFADVKENGLVKDQGPEAWGELLPLPSPEQKTRWDQLTQEIATARQQLDAKRAAIDSDAWLRQLKADVRDWVVQVPVKASAKNGAQLTIYATEPVLSIYETGGSVVSDTKPGNGLVVASGPNPDNETYTVTLQPGAGEWHSLGIEMNSDDRLPGARLARGSDRLVLTEVEATVDGKPAKFRSARSNVGFWDQGLTPWNTIDGKPDTGWGVATYRTQRANFLAVDFEQPVKTQNSTLITVTLRHDSSLRRAVTGRFRLALAPTANAQPASERTQNLQIPGLDAATLKAIDATERTDAQKEQLQALVESTHPDLAEAWRVLSLLESEKTTLRQAIAKVVTTVAIEPRETRVLPRGDWMSDAGAVVEPAIPGFLGKLETGGRRATRLDLANWLVSRDNPLTARVYVNRQWRQFFGSGLSKVLEDLGSQGEWPVHMELLDWLASEFASNWDMKHLTRTIVMSQTYRQSSDATPAMLEKDPDNRLLAHQVRYRVDAEVVRDVVLRASGLLSTKFGGPSVRPYQPEGYLAALNFPKRDYSESRGEDLYRRGVYTFWQRTFLHPGMSAFDAPSREECALNRAASNTPIQALVLLNDPTFVEAARVLGEKMFAAGDVDRRIDFGFSRAVTRAATAQEKAVLRELYRTELARFRKTPADAKALVTTGEAKHAAAVSSPEVAATISMARAILNLHEVITRN